MLAGQPRVEPGEGTEMTMTIYYRAVPNARQDKCDFFAGNCARSRRDTLLCEFAGEKLGGSWVQCDVGHKQPWFVDKPNSQDKAP
jgi:hypothetical protein